MGHFRHGLLAALLSIGLAGAAAAETFTYGSGVPERSTGNTGGVFPMLDAITEATDGRVAFNRLVGGQLVTVTGALRAVRDGAVDSGYMIVTFHPGELPYASLMGELTNLGTDALATMGALNEFFFVACEGCRNDFKKLGLVPMLVQSATPLAMHCTTPVSGAADIEGLKVSTLGSPEARWVQALGGTPEKMNFADLAQSLQLGRVDCALISISWLRSYGLQDIITNVLEMPQGVISGAVPVFFNQRAWDRISMADKKAIIGLMPTTAWDYVTNAYILPDAEVKRQNQKTIAYKPGDAALAEAWRENKAAEIAALVKVAEERNIPNGKALIEDAVRIFEKWHTQHLPAFKGDRAKFADILRRDVFSKYDFF